MLANNVWSAYHLKYFQNNYVLKSRDYTKPPDLLTLKAYPTPDGGGRLIFFFAKIREKDELKGTWSNFTHWLGVFEHRGENCSTPFGELGVCTQNNYKSEKKKSKQFTASKWRPLYYFPFLEHSDVTKILKKKIKKKKKEISNESLK